ncbi:allantoinase AllB [Actinocatenispora comari]|uniref:allantoinase n=1 Tax=Actinocatenispora comari TaxID=2807577 RepID=A0A8J4EKA3_9ACTN|nr:allantoinase AllB [Actinocatenispora comari]GIL26875.1 allantoinase [Actinocatenispora comari]
MAELTIRSRRVLLPDGERPASVHVRDGRIAAITDYTDGGGTDLGELALLPGLVDSHVHVDEPGRTEWEGFATATRAAAAGGVTTVIDMPLNSIPPTVDVDALECKRSAAEGQCAVDVGFWGGAVPDNLDRLAELHEAGVFGFKCFLADSGVPEFPPLSTGELTAVAHRLAELDALLLVHAEDAHELGSPAGGSYAEFLATRPERAEIAAVRTLAGLAAATGARMHVLHVSAAGALAPLAGTGLTAETCPHYLTLAAEEIAAGDTAAKCCPPVRSAANRDALWRALADGRIDCVVSDHSPAPPELKRGGFDSAWGGIASVQLGLPLVWTGARRRGHSLSDLVRWMAAGPARLVGLPHKGTIAVGADADLVAFAPDEPFTVDPAALHHRHPVSPYAGRRLTGVVHRTWLRGRPVDPAAPHGQLLRRPGSPGAAAPATPPRAASPGAGPLGAPAGAVPPRAATGDAPARPDDKEPT